MKHIVLICAGGFSTNILATYIRKEMKEHAFDGDIRAMSESNFQGIKQHVDVILLGPQLSYLFEQISGKYQGTDTKVAMIDMKDYGRMDGKHVFEQILKLLDE
ncbi:MAG: PTS sugar transporter subunit IIB [Erysipelotrichaceae bacterium]|nr:PTS sugar transporter subunit IIB [Erysipelotrichaceae bacterium]